MEVYVYDFTLSITKFTEQDIEFNVQHEMNYEIMRYIRDPLTIEETHEKTLKCGKNWKGNEQEWALMAVRLLDSKKYIGMQRNKKAVCVNLVN